MTTILDQITNSQLRNSNKIAFSVLNLDLSVKKSISFKSLENDVTKLILPTTSFPVLLLYEDVLEFIISFLACQKAGLTSIPMFFPKSKRHFERLKGIITDSQCEIILCEEANLDKIKKGLSFENDIKIFQTTEIDKLNNVIREKIVKYKRTIF